MALSNDEVIAMVKDKLKVKNEKIKEKDQEISDLKQKIEKLEGELAESYKKIENREKLIDTIGDILADEE